MREGDEGGRDLPLFNRINDIYDLDYELAIEILELCENTKV